MTFNAARPPGSEWYSRPLRLVLIYVIVGGLWVGVSDVLQLNFAFFPIAVDRLIFIAITAVLSYIVVRENRIVIEQSRAAEHESAARIRAYFNSAAEGLIVVDSQGRIVDANAKVVQMFGYTEPELIGQPIEVLVPERLRGQHGGDRAEYMRNPISRPMGFGRDPVGRRKDGSEFPIEVSLSYFATRQGGIVTGYITDVTERRQLEFQSRRSEAMAAIGTVAAGVAHELNNPLAIIAARAELVIAEASNRGLPEQLLNDLRVIHRNAHRASRVATELLTLARTPQKSHKPLNLNDLVNETMLLFREQTARDGIQIETALDPQIPPVSGDHTALSQVLTNLLSNAREAMPAGGVIRLKTSCPAGQPQAVQLTVEDTGNGIPAEASSKIFDLFYTTKSTGTGLGLWLSKRAVREHGGTVEVKSQVGQGTMFIVTLPALRAETEQTPNPTAIPQSDRS